MALNQKKSASANADSKSQNSRNAFKKKFYYKHTAKLKIKPLDFNGYLIKLFVGTLPLLCLLLVNKAFNIFNELGMALQVPNSIIILAKLVVVINTLYVIYISPFSFSKTKRIKNKLLKIIEVNNFFYEHPELKKITLSMIIKFYWENEQLILEVYTNGGKFTNKINELTSIFETTFNMTVISIQNDFADHTTYVLTDNTNNVIDSTNDWNV